MSLSFPTVRKADGRLVSPEPKPTRRDGQRRLRMLLTLVTGVLFSGAVIYFVCTCGAYTPTLQVLASVPAGDLVATHTSGFAIASQDKLGFLDAEGNFAPLEGGYEAVIPSGPWLVALNGTSMYLLRPDAPRSQAVRVQLLPGEKPLPVRGGDTVITYRGHPETRFGEPWHLRAISRDGREVWRKQLPYAPLFGACADGLLVLAAVDISGGGTPWVVCLSVNTGEVLWQKPLGAGVWRYAAVCPNGKVLAAVDSGVYVFTRDGVPALTYRPAGTVLSVDEHSGIVMIAVGQQPSGAMGRFFGTSQVTAVGPDGSILWNRKSWDSLPRVYVWAGRAVLLESGQVTWLEPETGKVLFSAKLDGYPVTWAKDVILVYKDDEFVLVDAGLLSP